MKSQPRDLPYQHTKVVKKGRKEKKSRIRETKNLSTDADSRTNTILEMLRDLSIKIK